MLYLILHACNCYSLCEDDPGMPKKKQLKPFRAVKAVKAIARDTVGTPPATRRDPNRKKDSKEKHKPTLGRLLSESE